MGATPTSREKWWRSSDLFEDCDGIRMALASPFETAWEAWQAARIPAQSVRLSDEERGQIIVAESIVEADSPSLAQAILRGSIKQLLSIIARLTAQPEHSKEE